MLGPVVLALVFASFRLRYKLTKFWAYATLWLTKNICGLDYQVEGIKNIPHNSNGIILCKHQSAWETIAMLIIFPPQVAVIKRELLWFPIWGWAASTLKPIAINRKNQRIALKNLIKQGTERLNEGLWVIIFPEGTRVTPREKTKFNAGGSLLAQLTQYPVIPVAHNAGEFWPRYSFLKYPGTIKVRIGAIIPSKNRKAHDINAEAEQWIGKVMREISPLNQ